MVVQAGDCQVQVACLLPGTESAVVSAAGDGKEHRWRQGALVATGFEMGRLPVEGFDGVLLQRLGVDGD